MRYFQNVVKINWFVRGAQSFRVKKSEFNFYLKIFCFEINNLVFEFLDLRFEVINLNFYLFRRDLVKGIWYTIFLTEFGKVGSFNIRLNFFLLFFKNQAFKLLLFFPHGQEFSLLDLEQILSDFCW